MKPTDLRNKNKKRINNLVTKLHSTETLFQNFGIAMAPRPSPGQRCHGSRCEARGGGRRLAWSGGCPAGAVGAIGFGISCGQVPGRSFVRAAGHGLAAGQSHSAVGAQPVSFKKAVLT